MWRWAVAAVLCGIAALLWTLSGREPPQEQFARALDLLHDGDFNRASELAASGERRSESLEWRLRFRLLQAEALLEAGKTENASSLLNSLDTYDSTETNVRKRVLRARHLMRKGDLHSAQTLLGEARGIVQQHRRSDLQAEVEMQIGQILGRQGQLQKAELSFMTARAAAVAAKDVYRQGSAANNLGMIQMIRSHCDEAIPFFEQAQHLYRQAGANHAVAAARNNIGLCYSQLGDLDNALHYRQAALELSQPSVLKANALGETGTVLLAEDPAKAVPFYRQARDMSRQFGALTDAARWAGNLALALAASRDWDAAETALKEAKQLGPEPRSRAFLELDAASIALGRGRTEEARGIYRAVIASSLDNPAVLWPAHAGMAATHIATGDTEKAVQSFELATRVIDEAQTGLNRNEHKLTFLSRLISFYQDYVDLLMSRDEPVRALTVADRSRARLLSERISRGIERTAGFSPEELRSIARESGSAWLSYWVAPKRSFLWVVTPDAVRVFNLPGEAEITSLVKEYRAFVETGLRDPMQTTSDAGRRLYEILIAPAAALLPRDSNLMVVPDGPLHQLSFDTLPVYSAGQPRYLIDDFTVAITPSFGVFLRKRASPVTGRDALIIGDPVAASPAFPALKHAGREITNVAAFMNSDRTRVITGDEARPEVWKNANPGSFSAIHIAAHAEANERSPLNSAIILSPGAGYRLYARDIIDVPLRAELVSLSACRSSGARTYAGEGMVGFAWAFLHAGAHSVVAGLWDVPDESTSMLIDELYKGIAAREAPAEALRKAQISVRKSAYSKPFYWGAFQCYRR